MLKICLKKAKIKRIDLIGSFEVKALQCTEMEHAGIRFISIITSLFIINNAHRLREVPKREENVI